MNLKHFIIIPFAVVVIVFGTIFYIQQKSIMSLEDRVQKLQIAGADNANKSINTNIDGNINSDEQEINEIIPNPSGKNNANQSNSSEGDGVAVSSPQNTPSPQESIKELRSLILKINDIAGEIKETQADSLIVEARIAEVSKLDQLKNEEINVFPSIVKNFKVFSDKSTVFTTKKFNELKVGDYIRAFSNKPIYDNDEFVATDISYLNEEAALLLAPKE